ncbi:substrate-binding periplasmic protein [Deinococcus yavapaiensis]|uniref:Polar amino acid transport system substrate-binding protein n=1 Tax=Deinococcus yavapaiensis KR-236 TaxID=694435 RepID=A0A318SBK7_9DEIO|nr:ABC transporter substrate-binding protein [Deinococcus yavapaiensis]PYE56428.1 polar amino acid transport system substrate-binding protein [Deinococcus yavapaiensis KR-236]
MSTPRKRRIRSLASLTLLSLSSLLPGSAVAADLGKIQSSGVLRIGFFGENPGLLTTSGREVSGFAVELMNAIAKEMKVRTISWSKARSSDELMPELQAGTFDAIFSTLGSLSDVDTSTPLACAGGVLLTRKGGPTDESGLKGRSVAVAIGTSSFYYVRNLPFAKKVNVFRTYEQAFHGFLTGGIDALVMERFDALKMYKKVGAEKYQVSAPLWNEYLYVIVPRDANKSLTAAINVAMKKFQQDGTYEKLSMRYFSQDVRCVQ